MGSRSEDRASTKAICSIPFRSGERLTDALFKTWFVVGFIAMQGLLACDTKSDPDSYDRDCDVDDDCVIAFYDACKACSDGAINVRDQDKMVADRLEHQKSCFNPIPSVPNCSDVVPSCVDDECVQLLVPEESEEGAGEGEGE
jgi:hypothetical protein